MHDYKMRLCFISAFWIFTNSLFAQIATVKEINQVNPITKEKYTFPKVTVLNAPAISQKINNELRLEILNAEPRTSDNKIFNKVWRTKQRSPSLSDLSYKISRNDKSLLSLSITAEGCGAYCETFTNHYTINLRTGNRLTLDSFLTRRGLEVLVDSLNISKQRKLKAKIIQLQYKLKTKAIQKDKNLDEYYTEMLNLYKECLSKEETIESIRDLEFSAQKNILKIFTDRCSTHYNMAVDELWTFEYVLSLNGWKEYLTKYGKAIAEM